MASSFPAGSGCLTTYFPPPTDPHSRQTLPPSPKKSGCNLDFAPLDRKLIDVDLLTADERRYVDAYHAETLAKVGPLLDGDVKVWLEAQCAPL